MGGTDEVWYGVERDEQLRLEESNLRGEPQPQLIPRRTAAQPAGLGGVADVELAKVGQFPHVEHVVLRLDELGLRVLRRVGEVSEAVEGRHLSALELRPADERRVAVRGDLEAEVVRVPREHELGVALRVRRLRREARELRVEEVLRVEDDVAVPVEEGWNVRELRRIAP